MLIDFCMPILKNMTSIRSLVHTKRIVEVIPTINPIPKMAQTKNAGEIYLSPFQFQFQFPCPNADEVFVWPSLRAIFEINELG